MMQLQAARQNEYWKRDNTFTDMIRAGNVIKVEREITEFIQTRRGISFLPKQERKAGMVSGFKL